MRTQKDERIHTPYREVNNFLDPLTGELLGMDIKNIEVVVGSPEEFCKTYVSFWNIIRKWGLTGADICLLSYLVEKYSDNAIFSISKAVKGEAATQSGKKSSSFNNSPKRLLDADIIYRVSDKEYRINPRYAFSGNDRMRREAIIRMSVEKKSTSKIP